MQLSVDNLYERPAERDEQELAELKHKLFFSEFGDHVTLLCIYDSWVEAGANNSKGQAWCEDNYFQARG
jgi:pre-mRNA-splicing factor ATP-dependent RNA helicase DHX16